MNKKKILIITVISLLSIIVLFIGYNYYRILTAKIIVVAKPIKYVEVYKKYKISDLITSINGKLVEDIEIDTSKVGNYEVEFEFINDDNIKVKYCLEYKVKDVIPPIIGVPTTYSVTVGYDKDLSKKFFCGDNYDDEPLCTIEGNYDFNTVGTYNLVYKAKDKSNNETIQNFILNVKEKTNNQTSTQTPQKKINISEVISKHKTKNTKIGIDVSRWQGNIDYEKVKSSGVEFAMIRVGSEDVEGNFFVDPMFEEYIEGFNKAEIPVGIYYYSYADTKEHALREAKWVLKQIKDYKVDLPVVYDWENWSNYQDFKVSFHHLSEIANTFIKTVEKAGYDGMLYSSKYYLENIWNKSNHKIWLAHYTEQTTYQGKYDIWQLCSNGYVPGIEENLVDINVMYN